MIARVRNWVLLGALAALIAAGLIGCNVLSRYHGFGASEMRPEALSARLKPAYRSFTPQGNGPWPTALLFSGCDGPKDNMDRWAKELTDEGYAVLVVDSHGPRDYDDAQLWRLVCIGQLLPGPERAGDVAVAIEDARAMPFVDPERIVLIGASHGGWSVLDMLSLHGQDKPPHNLTRWPETIQENGLEGIVGMVLLYPYCGVASQVYSHGWQEDVPGLFLLVEDDSIVNEDSCIEVIERMKEAGRPVEAHLFKGTTHGFDQEEKNAFSTLEFSPEATREAAELMRQFLRKVTKR
ncbi:Dienelactone hydrolase [Aliiruegeria lutimaris]|uniref:Dienelactone hydrolase n=1 Tax=Aliiruegeria lutimaris TaxID=571298 RepID=A0A1G9JSA6_9RHOB|nr:Dienelactone hydrolase [Aliiruegeria lutimaris]